MVVKSIKCPKCREKPTVYTEVWTDHSINFDAADGVPVEEGYMNEGTPAYVIARCECGHMWRLRGVAQITELR